MKKPYNRVQIEAEVAGKRQTELKSFNQKIWRLQMNGNNDPRQVPVEFRTIPESPEGDFIGEAVDTTFFQGSSENCDYFFLSRELIYLETQKVFGDGTFTLVKNLKYHQVYLLSTTFSILDRVISYPYVFILMRKRLG